MREYIKTILNGILAAKGKQPDWNQNDWNQPDWNQNDSTAPDYIKNRPFYGEVKYATLAKVKVTSASELKSGYFVSTVKLPSARYIFGEEYIIEVNGEKYSTSLGAYYDIIMGGYDLVLGDAERKFYLGNYYYTTNGNPPVNGDAYIGELSIYLHKDVTLPATVKVYQEVQEIHKLDEKYLPDELVDRKPIKLDANMAETYLNDSSYGDAALEAIKDGKQILVKVPNASGDNYVVNYSPVYTYQIPNYANKYLYLFFLRDEKQDLSALLSLPDGSVQIPVYDQLKMLLSQEYNSNPLES